MALLFFAGWVFAPRLLNRLGRAAMTGSALVQIADLTWLVADWPHVSLLSLAIPLALVDAGQSMLFVGLLRSVLADVPAYLGVSHPFRDRRIRADGDPF